MSAETHAFQAETQKLLDLMIHSLYSNKEVFLRELVSNASDAIDRRRFQGLTDASLLPDDELGIRLVADEAARTLTLVDNGIGMGRDDLVENLGTIARSGTLEYLKGLGDTQEAGPELIGQFGVGFYASFMVADRVEVLTRKAGEAQAWRWSSEGAGDYTIEEAERDEAGTTITLHLKPVDGDAGVQDFTNEWVLRGIVKRYSDFVAYPIRLEQAGAADAAEGEANESAPAPDDTPLNSMKAIWTRPDDEVSEDDYAEFYGHITHDHEKPLLHLRTRMEGTFEAQALLYVPAKAPFDLYHREMAHKGIQLYVKRVFIMDECRELMPEYLRFVKGVVDAEDLSLNVSREMLQQDRQIQAIRKHLVKKVIDALRDLKRSDGEKYLQFWAQFGPVLKEGLLGFEDKKERILDLVYVSTAAEPDKLVALSDVVERMPDDQDKIYFITGSSKDVLARSPHVEAFKAKGIEVCLFSDPVDEVWLEQMPPQYREKTFQSVGRGEVDLDDKAEGEEKDPERAEKSATFGDLLGALKAALEDDVKDVRLSGRLTDSPSCLVLEEGDLSPQLEAMLRQAGQDVPERKPILELNPDHPVLEGLQKTFEADAGDARIADYAGLLYSLAVLAEGGQLADPVAFGRVVQGLMTEGLGD
jgi:molecular chaperone HtpG